MSRRASRRSRCSTRRCVDSGARDMTPDESRIKAERPPRLDLTGIETVIFDKDGTLIDFHAMWGGWARQLGDRLDLVIRRPVSLDVYATIGFDPTTGRVASRSLLATGKMA